MASSGFRLAICCGGIAVTRKLAVHRINWLHEQRSNATVSVRVLTHVGRRHCLASHSIRRLRFGLSSRLCAFLAAPSQHAVLSQPYWCIKDCYDPAGPNTPTCGEMVHTGTVADWLLVTCLAWPHLLYAGVWFHPHVWKRHFPKSAVPAFARSAFIGKGETALQVSVAHPRSTLLDQLQKLTASGVSTQCKGT